MAKDISDLSIFGEYKQPENRVTAALLQICKIGGENLIRHIFTVAGILLPNSEISILTQPSNKAGNSVPDGLLKSTFSFNLYIESKIQPNSINKRQLAEHKKLLNEKADFLIYITPDEKSPPELKDTPWVDWRTLSDSLNSYTDSTQIDNSELLSFLIEEFIKLLDNMGLTSSGWSLENSQVLIVAGAWAEGVAINHEYYICQNKRSFKSSKYLAFYINSKINHLFRILESPIDDVNLYEIEELKIYLEKDEKDYNGEKRKVFKLSKVDVFINVVNDKIDKNGKPCPYTYGQPRYTTYEKIIDANKTSDL